MRSAARTAALFVVLAALFGAACSSGGSSSGTTRIDPEARARAERRADREEAREREEERAEREAVRLQEELAALPADQPIETAVLGLEAVPSEFVPGGSVAGQAFDVGIADDTASRQPPMCFDYRTTTIGYGALPPEDFAGVAAVAADPAVYFVHVVSYLDQALAVWNNFRGLVTFCTSSVASRPEGTVGVTLERLPPIRAGRVLGVGYRHVVTLPDVPATLYQRYVFRNGRCISDLTVAAQPVEPGQFAIPEALLQTAAERLNRVAGCEITPED